MADVWGLVAAELAVFEELGRLLWVSPAGVRCFAAGDRLTLATDGGRVAVEVVGVPVEALR